MISPFCPFLLIPSLATFLEQEIMPCFCSRLAEILTLAIPEGQKAGTALLACKGLRSHPWWKRFPGPSFQRQATINFNSRMIHEWPQNIGAPRNPPSRRVVARILFCPHHSYSSKRLPFSFSMSTESSSVMQEPSLCTGESRGRALRCTK